MMEAGARAAFRSTFPSAALDCTPVITVAAQATPAPLMAVTTMSWVPPATGQNENAPFASATVSMMTRSTPLPSFLFRGDHGVSAHDGDCVPASMTVPLIADCCATSPACNTGFNRNFPFRTQDGSAGVEIEIEILALARRYHKLAPRYPVPEES